jgi:DNA repair photolyase
LQDAYMDFQKRMRIKATSPRVGPLARNAVRPAEEGRDARVSGHNGPLTIQEIDAKTVLSKSGIPGVDYCINPYVGCGHACRYCYATFMKRFTGHREPWGSFVDVKENGPEVLRRQIKRAHRGRVMISSVTDPYQPVEEEYQLTRQCLEILLEYQFPVGILTKSPLVLRDVDLIKEFKEIEVGITVTTDDEAIRGIFEPQAPSIDTRIQTLKTLHEKGVETYAFIGPLLPMNPEALSERINPYVQSVLIDRMNYVSKTVTTYRRMNLKRWLEDSFLGEVIDRLQGGFAGKDVRLC